MKKNSKISQIVNVLYILAWVVILGSVVLSYFIKDILSPYGLGIYMMVAGFFILGAIVIIIYKLYSKKYK